MRNKKKKSMQAYTIFVSVMLVISSLWYYSETKRNQFTSLDGKLSKTNQVKRAPASFSDLAFGGPSLLADSLVELGGELSEVGIDLVKPMIIRSKLNDLLKQLKLKKSVRKRIKTKIDSDELIDQLVPFLFAVRDWYTQSDTISTQNFEDYIKNHYMDEELPGLTHSLFSWKTSKIEDEKSLKFNQFLDKEILAYVVKIYDCLYLQTPQIKFGQSWHRNEKIIKRTVPVLQELLSLVISKSKGDNATEDVLDGLKNLLDDPEKLETACVSLIDFITEMIHDHYKMFKSKLVRKEKLKTWLRDQLYLGNDGALWSFLKKRTQKGRFAVHIVVDGLQGHLVESLVSDTKNNPFLSRVLLDHQQREKWLPKYVKSTQAPIQENQFLEYLVKNGYENENYLPFFKDLYTNHRNSIAEFGVSTTPTISVRNIPIVQTGAGVKGKGGTGLPNFHFIDRKKDRAYYFYGNDSLMLNKLTKEQGMVNLFERLGDEVETLSCNAGYNNGARKHFDGFLNLALGEKVRDFGEHLCLSEINKRAINELHLKELGRKLFKLKQILTSDRWYDSLGKWIQQKRALKYLDEFSELALESMPKYLLYYNPWPDHFAHFKGPFSNEIISPTGELNRLDYWLGRMKQAYNKAEILDKTVFGMAGDHGLSPVYYIVSPEKSLFDYLKEKGISLKSKKISSDEGEGPKLTNPLHPPTMKGYDVIVASTAGGNYMMDFFVDQNENWTRQPLYSDLIHLTTLEGKVVNIPEVIIHSLSDSLHYLVVRETPYGKNGGTIRVMSFDKEQIVNAFVTRVGKKIYYEFHQKDLLEINALNPYLGAIDLQDKLIYDQMINKCLRFADKESVETWCNEEEWSIATRYSSNIGAVVQLAHLYDTDRAGTINLFPRFGVGYNTKVPGRHAGEDFHEKDAFFGLWKYGTKARLPLKSAVVGQLPPTLYQLLTGEKVTADQNGWGYSPVTTIFQ